MPKRKEERAHKESKGMEKYGAKGEGILDSHDSIKRCNNLPCFDQFKINFKTIRLRGTEGIS